jgi:hypothetical protein
MLADIDMYANHTYYMSYTTPLHCGCRTISYFSVRSSTRDSVSTSLSLGDVESNVPHPLRASSAARYRKENASNTPLRMARCDKMVLLRPVRFG